MSIGEPETALRIARRYLAESFRELWIRPAHQVYALDGLRALAILLVLCAHFFGDFWSNHVRETLPSMARWAPFYWGWTGVDLFFVLSGYLIGKQLWRERMETGTVRFVPFILRRGLRIWPLFFALLVYYTSFGPVHPKVWDYVFLTNFTRGKRGFDDAWSLSTEEQFYILVPFIIILSANIRWRWAYYVGIASTIGIEWGLRILVSHRLMANGLAGKPLLDAMHYPIFLHCDGLLAGLAIALLSIQFPVRFRTRDRGNPSYLGIAIFVMASVIAIVLRATSQIIFSFTSLGLIYGGLTLLMLWDRSVLSAPARWRIWYPISRLSYGMYLNNYFILPGVTLVSFTVVRQVTGSTMLACMFGVLAGIATSMAVATLTFIIVERPFLILRDRLVHRRVHMHASAG
jgi:peptidoglycan/LPS O-acetylase OafA/YrhL